MIFSDFDGTLTTKGELTPDFFKLMDLIKKNNSELVIVSGRSLSWGHFFLTHFPMKYAIMEGGGVLLKKDSKGRIKEELLCSHEDISTLKKTTTEIMKKYPRCVLSADSFGRKTDRAIEFFDMEHEDILEIEAYLENHGVNFSKSNVHINYWVGALSKYNAVKHFLNSHEEYKIDDCLFFGDAANDESMFESFPNTVGVSNISHIIDKLKFHPKIVLKGAENEGVLGVYSYLKNHYDRLL